jgi:hypothetical protein
MIPKIHHTVWTSGDEFKPKYHEWRASWVRRNPDWTFYFWNLHDAARLFEIMPDCCGDLLADFNVNNIYKSDILRLLAALNFGGVYSDCDVECIRPIPKEMMRQYSFCGECVTPGIGTTFLFGAEKRCAALLEIAIDVSLLLLKSKTEKYDCGLSNNIIGKLMLEKMGKVYPVSTFNPFGNHNEQFREMSQDEKLALFPDSYCLHHWTGQDPDGWNGIR